jgi:hypothetical protein
MHTSKERLENCAHKPTCSLSRDTAEETAQDIKNGAQFMAVNYLCK